MISEGAQMLQIIVTTFQLNFFKYVHIFNYKKSRYKV